MSPIDVSTRCTATVLHVVAERGDGKRITRALNEGESMLVGSDDQCGLQLPDPSVSSMHCLIRFEDNDISLQDWGESGTLVNGEPIDGIRVISTGDRAQLGSFQLTFVESHKEKTNLGGETDSQHTQPNEQEKDSPIGRAGSDEPLVESDEAWLNYEEPRTESAEPSSESSKPPIEIVTDHSELATQSTPPIVSSKPQVADVRGSVEQTTIELLKSEIELLETELSQKDAQLAELKAEPDRSFHSHEQSSPELEQRMERLLYELDQSDQRIAAFEEAMHLTEETSRAEAEEKRQLEAWVEDIERRIAEREAESQAECDVFRKRLEQANEERGQLQERIETLLQGSGGDRALEEMVQILRRDNEVLTEKVAQRDALCHELKTRCGELEQQTGEEYIQQRVHEESRKERLSVAQERAALSRQQLELTNKIHELKQELERQGRVHPADDKFRAFRQSLKEIHEQEKKEYVPPTISQRLVQLWQRLERPTDRD